MFSYLPIPSARRARSAAMLLVLAACSACSDLPPPPIGQLSLGLSSGFGDERFELSQASFVIEGAAELTLDSEDDPAADSLERTLPEGEYRVSLLDGWQLERTGAGGRALVSAELASENPLPFSILSGQLTTVVFQFRTLGGPGEDPAGGDGSVRIAIEVDGQSSPRVLISELMKNPDALPDADGEWLELHNAGSEAVDLDSCTLARDDQELSIEGSVVVAAGGSVTFANSETPGFVPDVLYSGLSLPNTGSFVLRLACGSHVLDEIVVDPAVPSQRAGRSLSLSGAALDPTENDDLSRWCEGAQSYNGDFGTPGAANPDCSF